MLDFIYNTPTKVYFGKDQEKKVGSIIKDLGYKKIMMQYGGGSIKKSGLYGTVMTALKDAGIEVVELGGVEPNPKLDFIRDAIKIAKEENITVSEAESIERAEQEKQIIASAPSRYKTINQADYGIW